jgi:L-amino acid N-acyltransferase YncA
MMIECACDLLKVLILNVSLVNFQHMDFSIRKATLRDLNAIVEIYNSTIESGIVTADTENVTVESKTEWFHSHGENRPLWVIEADQETAGWLSFHSFYGRPAYEITAELGIYIHSAYRGQGLGKIMLRKAISEAPSLGLENLVGFIFSGNLASLHLFQMEGFEKWGTLPSVAKFERHYQDLVIVGKKIK